MDPRKMMEKAIEVMRHSVDEPRADGKGCPKVGAVLVKSSGTVETACRGELRDGDHAEFTLLERKNRSENLDGSTLFTTLEPCAPGARSERKLGCAERIVLARINDVWVGIEDPDPTVARKGIKHLQESGVTVHMFEPDLQEEIKKVNARFLEEALRRAAEAEQPPEEISLSRLEEALGNATLDDLSPEALETYRRDAGIADRVGTPGFNDGLVRLKLLERSADRLVPTGFGLLLFGKEPRAAGMLQAGLLATIHYAEGTQEVRDFEGPLINIPGEVIAWLWDKLPNPIVRTEARRREANETQFMLAREGVVNALVHRD
jgi:ATP-dependent DNA helicase RecG